MPRMALCQQLQVVSGRIYRFVRLVMSLDIGRWYGGQRLPWAVWGEADWVVTKTTHLAKEA